MSSPPAPPRLHVIVAGASGTIGSATVAGLLAAGHRVTALVRPESELALPGGEVRAVDLADADVLSAMMHDIGADAVISCIASRTGVAADAWAVDYQANMNLLAAARGAGVQHFVLLSAICVQRPRLAFQHAKLAFEAVLASSGIRHSIVRPTAFFKSLSGQIDRVRSGKPYLLFGDGRLTACKPISDADLAATLVSCLSDPAKLDRILPIGGPGPAITPREQGEALFALTGQRPRFRSVPPGLLLAVAQVLGVLARVVPPLASKAEYARIGHYYATESMLLLDPVSGEYDAAATPETGSETLFDHYRAVLAGR
ncbi:MAG: NAD(P)H-binding protein [Sphingopyxis sp.]|nr:NAD(P)H-binding protein [Sphingopyxis sp.]